MSDTLIYNGKSFAEFNTFFDGSKAFGSPEKDYELIEIPGRNGSLSIYNDRFKDIELSFPCFIRNNFLSNYRNLLAYLNSQEVYQRLTTSKEPTTFRMALFKGIVEPQTTAFNHGGFFTIVFYCKPQRFLLSGETPVDSSSQNTTYTGNPVTIENPSGLSSVSSLQVSLEPNQDLHGYEYPWVGGAGKNLFDKDGTFGHNGTTHVATDTGVILTTGSTGSNKNAWIIIPLTILGNTVTISADVTRSSTNNGSVRLYYVNANNTIVGSAITSNTITSDGAFSVTVAIPATLPEDTTNIALYLYACTTGTTGVDLSVTYKDLQIEIGSTKTAWVPYENICPIYPANGKNLLPNVKYQRTTNQVRFGNDTGTAMPLGAGTYTLSVETSATSVSLYYVLSGGSAVKIVSGTTGTVTFSEDVNVLFYIYRSGGISVDDVGNFQLERGASASPYVPYMGINVVRTGVNLLGGTALRDAIIASMPTATTGTDEDGDYVSFAANATTVKPIAEGIFKEGSRYTFILTAKKNNSSDGMNMRINYTDSTYTSVRDVDGTTKTTVVQVSANNKNVTTLTKQNSSGTTYLYYNESGIFEGVLTADDYVPYQGTTYYSILPSAVYGGTVDISTGELTVTHQYGRLPYNSSWTKASNGSLFHAFPTMIENADSTTVPICNAYKGTEPASTNNTAYNKGNGTICFRSPSFDRIYIRDDRFATVDDFKNYLQNNEVWVCSKLATPTTTTLTPQQISLLLGTNVISADSNLTIIVSEPSELINPTLFESKPLIRCYGSGTVNINDQYITVSANTYEYIDIDCELMDARHGLTNCNSYVSFSTTGFITLKAGSNYIAPSGFTKVEITPRWYEV